MTTATSARVPIPLAESREYSVRRAACAVCASHTTSNPRFRMQRASSISNSRKSGISALPMSAMVLNERMFFISLHEPCLSELFDVLYGCIVIDLSHLLTSEKTEYYE